MKNILLFAVLCLAEMTAFSQKCKFDFDKVDPFSNEKEQRISYKPSFNGYFSMAFYHKGNDYRIESYVNMPGKQEFEIPVGHKLEIKLGDGTHFTLENATKALPVAFVGGDQVMTSYSMSYHITKEQYQQIAASGITFMRTWLQDANYYDYEFKKKEPEKTKAAATCILGN
jgi:hypothetical protein